MSPRRLLALGSLLLLSGCLYHAAEHTDQTVCDLTAHPFDLAPPEAAALPPDRTAAPAAAATTDVRTAALMQGADRPAEPSVVKPGVKVPPDLPGAETPLLPVLPKDRDERRAIVRKLYPPLPALPEAPEALPGPGGKPYTLSELQEIAAGNSPTLRQAASDVEAAKGNLLQAWAYPNPTVAYQAQPSSDGSTPGSQGVLIDQSIKTGGKLKLQAASAEKALENSRLALKRARSDLSTQVRNAYFAVLVAKETVRVTRALAKFTDEVYRFQEDLLESGGFAAPYEPAALRAQAYTARLAHRQALQTYLYSWKQLVAAVGLRQLPLTEVAGRIDACLPYYDYDTVLAHVLQEHTDVLTARNGLDAAKYNLKLAQVTGGFPDIDVQLGVLKDYVVAPRQVTPTAQVGIPIPLWDQNRGNIIAAEAALVRAGEEPHRVETNLTNNLATAYAGYKNNLDALEYYRKYILPDLVRTVRGVEERRRFDQALSLADLATAQQNLATSVTSYLTILGQLWTSTVSVADLLQTDDLFQLAQPRDLPPLPDLDHLPPLPCSHPCAPADSDCHVGGVTVAPAAQASAHSAIILTSVVAIPAAPASSDAPSDRDAALAAARRRTLQPLREPPAAAPGSPPAAPGG